MDMNNAQQWTAIGQTSNQLILYHPSSHALSVQPHTSLSIAGPSRPTQPLLLPYIPPTPDDEASLGSICPTCSQPLPSDRVQPSPCPSPFRTPRGELRTRGYFQILEDAHEMSRPPSPSMSRRFERTPTPAQEDDDVLDEMHLPAKGYYGEYFREERKLGMGAEGSVFLATHIISGNVLGTYAVKKIAVGRSKAYLVKMLREVKLLEALRHPNIIPYHHSWVDVTTFSSFGEPITALHVLMMYATAGNLDTYLITRAHSPNPTASDLTASGLADGDSLGQLPRAERIKAFKQRRQSSVGATGARKKREETRGVLLLGVEEIGKLFGDVVEGLAFLHANSILHLDLKCSNVLLHWEDGKLIPKALLSDFGTSEEMLKGKRERTGHTGTMAYMAPETLVTDIGGNWRPSDSHADMWSLGLILYKLLYLQLPFPDTEDYESLLQSIIAYPGFVPTAALYAACERRHIPRELLVLLSKLINVDPNLRPTAEKVRTSLRGLESQARSASNSNTSTKAGLVAKVQKFSQGMVSYISSPPPEGNTNFVQPYRLPSGLSSPVQPVLALPSPPLETPFYSGQMHRNVEHVQPTRVGSKVLESRIRFLIAAAKILLLQVGTYFDTRIKILLIILTLVEIKWDEWSITMPTTVIFTAMVVGQYVMGDSK